MGTTAPQDEIVVRQLYPDTDRASHDQPRRTSAHTASRPAPLPLAACAAPHGRRERREDSPNRRVWLGIAAIIVVLLAIGFLACGHWGGPPTAVLPSASAPALVGVPATPAVPLAPTLVPLPSPVPTAVSPTSIPSTPDYADRGALADRCAGGHARTGCGLNDGARLPFRSPSQLPCRRRASQTRRLHHRHRPSPPRRLPSKERYLRRRYQRLRSRP